MPLTAGDFSPNMLFSSAWGGSICAEYSLPIAIPLALRLGVGYSTGGFLSASNMDVPGSLGETTVLAGASYTKPLPTDFPFVVLLMQGQPTAAFRPEQALPMQRFRPAWESPLP